MKFVLLLGSLLCIPLLFLPGGCGLSYIGNLSKSESQFSVGLSIPRLLNFPFELNGDAIGARVGGGGSAVGQMAHETLSAGLDLNGDGYADVVVGAPTRDGNAGASADSGWMGVYSGFDQTLLWSSEGENSLDAFGFAVSNLIGDFDSDGYNDFIGGAPHFDGSSGALTDSGKFYVFSGGPPDRLGKVLLSKEGPGTGALLGFSVTFTGNTNSVAGNEIAVSAPYWNNGSVYLYTFGNPAPLHTWNGSSPHFGFSITGLFKYNGDDELDIGIGAPDLFLGGRDAVSVFGLTSYGLVEVFQKSNDLETFGHSLSFARLNPNTSTACLLVGSPFFQGAAGSQSGKAELFCSYSGTSAVWSEEGDHSNDNFGIAVAGLTDFEGNLGEFDFAVGAHRRDGAGGLLPDSGSTYVYSGDKLTQIFSADGERSGDHFGFSLSVADLLSIGSGGIAIGAPRFDQGALVDPGRIYLWDRNSP